MKQISPNIHFFLPPPSSAHTIRGSGLEYLQKPTNCHRLNSSGSQKSKSKIDQFHINLNVKKNKNNFLEEERGEESEAKFYYNYNTDIRKRDFFQSLTSQSPTEVLEEKDKRKGKENNLLAIEGCPKKLHTYNFKFLKELTSLPVSAIQKDHQDEESKKRKEQQKKRGFKEIGSVGNKLLRRQREAEHNSQFVTLPTLLRNAFELDVIDSSSYSYKFSVIKKVGRRGEILRPPSVSLVINSSNEKEKSHSSSATSNIVNKKIGNYFQLPIALAPTPREKRDIFSNTDKLGLLLSGVNDEFDLLQEPEDNTPNPEEDEDEEKVDKVEEFDTYQTSDYNWPTTTNTSHHQIQLNHQSKAVISLIKNKEDIDYNKEEEEEEKEETSKYYYSSNNISNRNKGGNKINPNSYFSRQNLVSVSRVECGRRIGGRKKASSQPAELVVNQIKLY